MMMRTAVLCKTLRHIHHSRTISTGTRATGVPRAGVSRVDSYQYIKMLKNKKPIVLKSKNKKKRKNVKRKP